MVARGREKRKLVVSVSRDERNELKGEKTHDVRFILHERYK
jgi:hypothetical protein